MKLWIRLGDQGDYHSFDTIEEAAEFLVENQIEDHLNPIPYGRGALSKDYKGQNYISIYYGEIQPNFTRSLHGKEFTELNQEIKKLVKANKEPK